MESFNPVGRRNACLKQKGTHNIVGGTDNALGLTVLWGSVQVWKSDTICEKERVGRGIVKFPTVVALDAFDSGAKLCRHKGKEMSES